jgi:hypothetical protein
MTEMSKRVSVKQLKIPKFPIEFLRQMCLAIR